MWVFTIYGFFSIASADKEGVVPRQIDPNTVMVRARTRQHLETLQERFPFLKQYEIQEWAARDYGYRIICPKADWVLALTEMAEEQEWSNFKDEAHHNQVDIGAQYISCLHRVWSVMLSLQPWIRAKHTPAPKGKKRKKGESLGDLLNRDLDRDGDLSSRYEDRMVWHPCPSCGRDTLQKPPNSCLMCQETAKDAEGLKPVEEL